MISVFQEVILARYSGAVLVADIDNLSNLLGESPEWFEICPQVQQAHEGGFLSLEVGSWLVTLLFESITHSAY